MKRIFLVIGLATLFWQCQDIKYPEAPENLIDKETMIKIYTDAYLANASKNFNRTILLRQQVDLTDYIYKKYNIDSLQYEKSNAYYSADLDQYREMYLVVQANIDQRFAQVDSIVQLKEEAERKRKDSVQKARKRRNDSLGIDTEPVKDSLSKPRHSVDSMIRQRAVKTVSPQISPRSVTDSIP